jgi:hypothetical protein
VRKVVSLSYQSCSLPEVFLLSNFGLVTVLGFLGLGVPKNGFLITLVQHRVIPFLASSLLKKCC